MTLIRKLISFLEVKCLKKEYKGECLTFSLVGFRVVCNKWDFFFSFSGKIFQEDKTNTSEI